MLPTMESREQENVRERGREGKRAGKTVATVLLTCCVLQLDINAAPVEVMPGASALCQENNLCAT